MDSTSDEGFKLLVEVALLNAPDISSDAAAAALGLVPNGAVLNPSRVVAHRKALGMKNSELAARLAERGWQVSGGQVLQWQTGERAFVAAALARALAAVFHCDISALQARDGALSRAEASLLEAPGFAKLVARAQAALRLSRDAVESMLLSKYRGLAFRGGEPETDHALEALEAFVSSLEAGGSHEGR